MSIAMLSSTYHDEKLISIAVADDSLAIEISAQNKKIIIKVNELEKLRVTDFKEGNIINVAQVIYAGGRHRRYGQVVAQVRL